MIRVHLKAPSRTHRDQATAQWRIGFQPLWAEILAVGVFPGWSAFSSICG
jgi:hypothetical protein